MPTGADHVIEFINPNSRDYKRGGPQENNTLTRCLLLNKYIVNKPRIEYSENKANIYRKKYIG